MPKIHPMAVVEAGATLAEDVVVGAFAYVGAKAALGKGCVLHHHAQVEGNTVAGENNVFFPNSVVGAVSQDLKYRGGNCRVEKKRLFLLQLCAKMMWFLSKPEK